MKAGSSNFIPDVTGSLQGAEKGLKIIALAGAVLGAVTMSAQACEETLAVAYQGSEAGKLTIEVNDVILLRDHPGSFANFIPPSLLLEGENILRVRLVKDAAAAGAEAVGAKAEVFKACQGTFPEAPGQNENVIGEISLDQPGEATTGFTVKDLPAYGYLSAEPTDDKGLLEAITLLRQAASDGDMDAYMAFLTPLKNDLVTIEGMPANILEGMATDLLGGDYKVSEPGALTVHPVLGGRAYQVATAEGDGPLIFVPKDPSNQDLLDKLAQAGIWIKTDDGWKILRH
ncbi:nuclear transport factor 2 family protein [Kiloniella laminariae]|uniref:nuclear transport factor 2 family protein n=1 Tax=Kiloniella laminariae TaxID=454162 RepID=UPI0012F9D59A|nr:nuclear transport factor 2 family protein [Kiloniella laminariae]